VDSGAKMNAALVLWIPVLLCLLESSRLRCCLLATATAPVRDYAALTGRLCWSSLGMRSMW
jgi:hypothetical protein